MKPADGQRGAAAVFILASMLIGGCEGSPPAEPTREPVGPAAELGTRFDPSTTGSIAGQVLWEGTLPHVDKFERVPRANEPYPFDRPFSKENVNAPRINEGRGVQDAVIFLRSVDLARAKAWDLPAVSIEQRDYQIHVLQGSYSGRAGVVRRGSGISAISRDATAHSLRFKGTGLFTLPLPDPDQPLERLLPDAGLIELSDGIGYYWMRGYLFVDDHPYYVRSDAQGRFELRDVPPGSYELVCWHPSWQVVGQERNPDSGQFLRIQFGKPAEIVRKIVVESRQQLLVDYTLSSELFPPARE